MLKIFEIAGALGILLVIVLLVFLPLILTIIVGIAFANMFGFTGITWWAFIILFYLIICTILGMVGA